MHYCVFFSGGETVSILSIPGWAVSSPPLQKDYINEQRINY
ncbi:hypothetical protein yrohd0001_16700 [Yersinia rohdei ATCC 43380]|nr:hypothetical protein yrohd0001_16700 [Yersinia rohdei ATCC 43380]